MQRTFFKTNIFKNFNLAMQFLWREWRAGEWYILAFALLLAVGAVTALHFYTDRLMRGLDQQSAKFLGGDLVISTPYPISPAWKQKAQDLQLRSAEVWSYPSVVSAKNRLQFVTIQAVSKNYPLIDNSTPSENHTLEPLKSPQDFSIWVEPRLLPLLSIHINDTITIGAANFKVKKTITDTDTLNTGWIIAPRILVSLEDIPATRTVIPGSRVDYRLLMTGNTRQLKTFADWITPQLTPGQHLLDVHNQQFLLRDTLQRVDNYLQLVLLFCLLMSGVAIALSIQHYLKRHFTHVATLRCLGASKKQILQCFLWQLFIVGFIAGLIGIAIGYGLQALFANLFKDFLQFPLPAVSIKPIFLGFATSLFLLFTFAFPVIKQLPDISPLAIWRNEIATASRQIYFIIALIGISVFLFFLMDFSLLALFFVDIVILSIGFLSVISFLMLSLIRRNLDRFEGSVRRGLSQLANYPESVTLQFVGFTLVLISLIVLGLVRSELIANWQQSLPKNTPNYFAFNIAPTDLNSLQQFLKQHQVPIEGLYPMVRGRLITLNGKEIVSAVPPDARNNNALHRELNLSWMLTPPKDNKIVSGPSFSQSDTGKALVSVENILAENLQLHLGDQLTFQVGDQKLSARIYNFRKVDWQSFHPNFFMVFPPGLIDQFPSTYITSFHLNQNQTNLLNLLVQQFPNITIIDVANLLKQVQDLLNKIIVALQYLFLFALAAGILIVITSIQASMDERRQTYRLLRVLGASQKYIVKSITVEACCFVLIITITSFVFAKLITFAMMRTVF